MNKLSLPLLVCTLLVPAAVTAATFEGTLSMKFNNSRGEGAVINMSVKDGLTRTDMQAGEGQSAAMIMDMGKRQMTILIPQRKMYMVRPIPQPGASPNGAPSSAGKPDDTILEKTGVTEKILGYDCVKFVATHKDGKTTELWVTDELGTFMGLGSGMGGGPMGPRAGARNPTAQGWEQLLQGKDMFPMRVVTTAGGKEESRMEVTAVEKKSLSDSLFMPPEGWTDMAAMMRGMMPPGMAMPGGNGN